MTRNLVLQMAVSLDGFVARADNSLDWGPTSPDPEHYDWIYELLEGAGTHIMGRRAYEDMSPYWPTSDDKMAPRMNDTPKVVFSKTLPSALWAGTRIARGDLVEEITALKAEHGGEIVAHGWCRPGRSRRASSSTPTSHDRPMGCRRWRVHPLRRGCDRTRHPVRCTGRTR